VDSMAAPWMKAGFQFCAFFHRGAEAALKRVRKPGENVQKTSSGDGKFKPIRILRNPLGRLEHAVH